MNVRAGFTPVPTVQKLLSTLDNRAPLGQTRGQARRRLCCPGGAGSGFGPSLVSGSLVSGGKRQIYNEAASPAERAVDANISRISVQPASTHCRLVYDCIGLLVLPFDVRVCWAHL